MNTKQNIIRILLFGGLLQSCQSPYVGGPSPCGSSRSKPVGHTQQRIHTRCSYPMHRPAPAVYFKSNRIISPLVCRCEPSGDKLIIYTGTDRFDKLLLGSDVFVDKSLFIQEFLESGDEVALITRPRRWGKSMNMDMLKCFLSIEVDDQGNPLPREQCLNPKLFAGGEVDLGFEETKLLKPLRINDYPSLMKRQGQFPVISIGFKDVDGKSYQKIEEAIQTQIVDLYKNHGYLQQYVQDDKTGWLFDSDREKLQRYFAGKLSETDIKNSLKFLSELLYKHFGKPVYILIDEYDMPINRAYLKCTSEELKNVLELFRGILGAALKGNPYLKKGLVTGILRLAKADLFSGLNNIRAYILLDRRFATSYGFTEQEVDELLSKVP
ncbi:MAG: AAA family ATPase, partial [Bacteroidota bacterium]